MPNHYFCSQSSNSTKHSNMKFTYYGHSCFEIEVAGKRILFDPFISGNEQAKEIDINSIQPDYVLISHGHGDHIADAVQILKSSGAFAISTYEVVMWLNKQGCENGRPMNHGGQFKTDFGTVKLVNAVHSSDLPDGSYGGNPVGFVINTEEGNFYYAGDTALTMDMKLIPLWSKLDFSILPIGDNFTMGLDDAVIAADFVDCDKIIGVHFDTFGFIKINHEEAVSKFAAAKKELILPKIGQSIEL